MLGNEGLSIFGENQTWGKLLTKGGMVGKVFYVDGTNGDDANAGTNPLYPLQTIAAGVTLCTTRKQDYIFVFESYTQETFPLVIDKRDIHLIGLTAGGFLPRPVLLDGNGEAAIKITATGHSLELSGFRLSSTGGADPGILVDDTVVSWNCHIHNCTFGVIIAAQDGILISGSTADIQGWTIEDCYFGQLLSRDGIRANNTSNALIRNNIFRRYTGIGVNIISSDQMGAVLNNVFQSDSTTAGFAINLGSLTNNGMIDGNRAMEDGAAPGNNPYVDASNASAASLNNAWGLNYKGITATYPDAIG